MKLRPIAEYTAAVVLPILFTIALASFVLHVVCLKHDGEHSHVVCADLEYGVYTQKEIDKFESYVPPPGLGSKTPPSDVPNAGPLSETLTIVVDFKEPGEPNTEDVIGNTVGTFDVTSFGFSTGDFEMVTSAIMAELQEDYFDELVGTIANRDSRMFDIDIIEGEIGTPPSGVDEYYFVQVGTGIEGPFIFALGVAAGSAVRNAQGIGPNGSIELGDVVSSVFTDIIQGIGGLEPADALSSGNLEFTTNAIVGTLAHEIGHVLSLSHISSENSVQPTAGAAPIMGTGAIDLVNQLRLTDREFSFSGMNGQQADLPVYHVSQLVNAIGLTNPPFEAPPASIVGGDDFDSGQNFMSRELDPDLSNSDVPGTFPGSIFDVFGIVDRTVNEDFSDDTLINSSLTGLFPTTITDRFLAQADLANPNNNGSASVLYTIDISDLENLEFSIDLAAMGDFESSDHGVITATVDNGIPQIMVTSFFGGNFSQEYFFEDGSSETLNDPMTANGVLLNNSFQTFTQPIIGNGSILTIEFLLTGNGGDEEVAYDNIVVRGDFTDKGIVGDVNCDGVVDLLDIEPFVQAITNNVFDFKADINGDGEDNLLDVAGLVQLLTGG